jgi:hypothetical protein
MQFNLPAALRVFVLLDFLGEHSGVIRDLRAFGKVRLQDDLKVALDTLGHGLAVEHDPVAVLADAVDHRPSFWCVYLNNINDFLARLGVDYGDFVPVLGGPPTVA